MARKTYPSVVDIAHPEPSKGDSNRRLNSRGDESSGNVDCGLEERIEAIRIFVAS